MNVFGVFCSGRQSIELQVQSVLVSIPGSQREDDKDQMLNTRDAAQTVEWSIAPPGGHGQTSTVRQKEQRDRWQMAIRLNGHETLTLNWTVCTLLDLWFVPHGNPNKTTVAKRR